MKIFRGKTFLQKGFSPAPFSKNFWFGVFEAKTPLVYPTSCSFNGPENICFLGHAMFPPDLIAHTCAAKSGGNMHTQPFTHRAWGTFNVSRWFPLALQWEPGGE